jgi:regulator of replication initiation timing
VADETKDNKITGKSKPFYLNWKFWLALLVSQIVLLILAFLIFTPAEIERAVIKFLIDPTSYVPLGIVAAGVAGVWAKVDEKLKEIKKKAEEAALKASVAAISARAVGNQTNTNSADIVALGDAYRALVDEYQQSRVEIKADKDSDRAEIAELKQQLRGLSKENQGFLREITELKTQLREMGRENIADKQEITVLRAKVANLEMEVAKLITENSYLLEENRGLKNSYDNRGRRVTDQLPPLPQDIQAEFEGSGLDNHFEPEGKQAGS